MTTEKNVIYTLFEKKDSSKLDKLIKTYQKDPYTARVIFFNGDKNEYYTSRLIMFEKNNGDFEICVMRKTFGISITNRMYSREKKETSIIYSKKKFYYKNGNKFTQLTYNGLENFLYPWYGKKINNCIVGQKLIDKFSWIRFISENNILHATAFNTFLRYKLFSLKDALRHIFKAPWPVIKILLSVNQVKKSTQNDNPFNIIDYFDDLPSRSSQHPLQVLKSWKETSRYLKNIESLKPALYHHHVFNDTCRMAKILDKKVNCSWSTARLIEEHDKWSREITYIILANESKYDLKIAEVYHEFAKFSGYNLLTTNIDVLGEGMIQKHCVGTYIDGINKGNCAIFHIEGFTLEVRYRLTWNFDLSDQNGEKVFQYGQFRGRHNALAPKELDDAVKRKIEEFDAYYKEKLKEKKTINQPVECFGDIIDML